MIVRQYQQLIFDKDLIVVDIETTGLNPRQDDIIGIGLSDGTNSYYLLHKIWNVEKQKLVDVLPINDLVKILQQLRNKKILTHNAAFDLPFILHYTGVDLLPYLYADTILLVHTCDENRFSYKLKDLASEHFGKSVVSEQTDMLQSIKNNGGTKSEFYKADHELMAKYCIQDCLLTYRLYQTYLPKLERDNLSNFFFNDEVMPLYKEVTIPMEQVGVQLDMPLVQGALLGINKDLEELEDQIIEKISAHLGLFSQWFLNKEFPPSRSGDFAQNYCRLKNLNLTKTKSGSYSLSESALSKLEDGHDKDVLTGKAYMTEEEVVSVQKLMWSKTGQKHMFNLLSTHHIKKLAFDTLKLEPLSRTPTGQPQADEEFLESIKDSQEWARDLLIYRKLQKIKGTYIERFLEAAEPDGKFYPKFKQHGTVTGRYSGDFQQLPRKVELESSHPLIYKYTNMIRDFFIASPGRVFIDADYESLEPHVFAHISRDPNLLKIFQDKLDFYSTICIRTEKLQGYSSDKKADNYLGKLKKDKRQSAKAYALGIAYGEEDWKLHKELNITQDEAKLLIRGYWEGFPVLKQVSDENRHQIMMTGRVKTETGRIRRLPEAKYISDNHGTAILDSLWLWKEYNEFPSHYEKMKKLRKTLKKCLNAAINYPTQGLAASIVNRSAIAAARAFKEANLDAKIVANVHDELLVDCAEAHKDSAAKILQNCMENTYKISLPLKAEPVIVARYGDAK